MGGCPARGAKKPETNAISDHGKVPVDQHGRAIDPKQMLSLRPEAFYCRCALR
jgi:hypothetical protein